MPGDPIYEAELDAEVHGHVGHVFPREHRLYAEPGRRDGRPWTKGDFDRILADAGKRHDERAVQPGAHGYYGA